ncbi:hypothetical protein [Spiroplasma endosymbiont of Nomada rufipes]
MKFLYENFLQFYLLALTSIIQPGGLSESIALGLGASDLVASISAVGVEF